MPKQSDALTRLPPQTQNALIALGTNLAVARMRRKESLRTWAARVGVTVPTLMKMESGDPGVSMGAYASALWLIGRDGELGTMASPEFDRGALELDVREAMDLGKKMAVAAQNRAHARATTAKAKIQAAK